VFPTYVAFRLHLIGESTRERERASERERESERARARESERERASERIMRDSRRLKVPILFLAMTLFLMLLMRILLVLVLVPLLPLLMLLMDIKGYRTRLSARAPQSFSDRSNGVLIPFASRVLPIHLSLQ